MPRGVCITGSITDSETGQETLASHYLYPTGAQMNTIVKVIDSKLYEHTQDFQVVADCLGLDNIGGIFNIGLNFCVATQAEADAVMADLRAGAILAAHGDFTVSEDGFWTIHNPRYSPVSAEDVVELEQVFLKNRGGRANE